MSALLQAEYTVPTMRGAYGAWHRGRRLFAVWAIAVDLHAVHARVQALRRLLGDTLLPDYRRQPHITLHICGFPVAGTPAGDEYGRAQLALHCEALQASAMAPFVLQLWRPFSFTSAACLGVEDPDEGLLRIRRCLQGAVASADATPYTPHVTAGFFRRRVPMASVRQRLAAAERFAPIPVPVTQVECLVYDTSAVDGPLSSVAVCPLAPHPQRASARFTASTRAAFAPPFAPPFTSPLEGAADA